MSACGLIYAGAQRTSARPASPSSSCDDLLDRAPKKIFVGVPLQTRGGQPLVVQHAAGIRNLCDCVDAQVDQGAGRASPRWSAAPLHARQCFMTRWTRALFKAPVAKADRSRMNVVFDSGNTDTDAAFVKFCDERGPRRSRAIECAAACAHRYTTRCRLPASRRWWRPCET